MQNREMHYAKSQYGRIEYRSQSVLLELHLTYTFYFLRNYHKLTT